MNSRCQVNRETQTRCSAISATRTAPMCVALIASVYALSVMAQLPAAASRNEHTRPAARLIRS